LPGFPQGQVPKEIAALHNKLEFLDSKLQGHKGSIIENIIKEENTTQPFNHFSSSSTLATQGN